MVNREKQRKTEIMQKRSLEDKVKQAEIINNLAKEVKQLKDQIRTSQFDKNEADYNNRTAVFDRQIQL